MFHSIQSFFIAATNISKIFWPQDKNNQRGQELKTLLSIDDSSVLYSRSPRNIFEHYDERLEKWYKQSTHHNVMDMSMGYKDDMATGNIDYLRFFNTTTFTFRFRGESYEIKPIFEEIKNLMMKVTNELSRPPSI